MAVDVAQRRRHKSYLIGGERRRRRHMWKETDLKIKIVDGALLRIMHALVAASENHTIRSQGDGLSVDDIVGAEDHDSIIIRPLRPA